MFLVLYAYVFISLSCAFVISRFFSLHDLLFARFSGYFVNSASFCFGLNSSASFHFSFESYQLILLLLIGVLALSPRRGRTVAFVRSGELP